MARAVPNGVAAHKGVARGPLSGVVEGPTRGVVEGPHKGEAKGLLGDEVKGPSNGVADAPHKGFVTCPHVLGAFDEGCCTAGVGALAA